MFCPKCGRQLEEGISFCPNCGTAQHYNATPSPNIAQTKTEGITISKSFLKKGILIVIMAVVLISVCVTLFSRGADKKVAGTQNTSSSTVDTIKTPVIVGKWQEKDTPSVYLTLNKDNTGEMSSGGWAVKLNWSYSKTTNAVTMEIPGMGSSTATYNPKDDTISRNGVIFVRVS